jgi:hypothetical protein
MAIHFSPSVSCPSQKKAKCAPRQSNKWVKHKGDWTSFLTENSFTHMRDVTGAERERERGRERKREREWDREEANDLKLQLNAYLHMINKLPKMYRQLSFWPFMMNVAFCSSCCCFFATKLEPYHTKRSATFKICTLPPEQCHSSISCSTLYPLSQVCGHQRTCSIQNIKTGSIKTNRASLIHFNTFLRFRFGKLLFGIRNEEAWLGRSGEGSQGYGFFSSCEALAQA